MFIRIKKHKNNKYAYLVRNKRYKIPPHHRQKVISYLGKVIIPKKHKEISFKKHLNKDIKDYLKNTKTSKIFIDLINLELEKHNLKVNLNNIEQNNKPLVIELNEGFLCNYTLNQLLNFRLPIKTPDKEASTILAKTILEAGIKIPPYLFIQIFKKLKY